MALGDETMCHHVRLLKCIHVACLPQQLDRWSSIVIIVTPPPPHGLSCDECRVKEGCSKVGAKEGSGSTC